MINASAFYDLIIALNNDEPEEGDTWTTAIELYAQMFNVN